MEQASPLETVMDEMIRSADAGLNLVALAVAVAVPALCASLSMESGRSQGPEYLAWCRANLYPNKGFDFVTPEELYAIRNGLLHQGRVDMVNFNRKAGTTSPAGNLKRAVFITSDDNRSSIGNTVIFGEYVYTVRRFCERMQNAALDWLSTQQANPIVQRNLEAMIRYRPFESQGIKIPGSNRMIY